MQDDNAMSATEHHISKLQEIWDEVVERIIKRMMEIIHPAVDVIHIDLHEELIYSLANLHIKLVSEVARKRMDGRNPLDIDIETERRECFSSFGLERIENTAKSFAEAFEKRYRERWRPKSLAILEREKTPRKPTHRSPKPVEKNHYIGKSFIRKYWSTNGQIKQWWKNASGKYVPNRPEPFGKWGHQKNLYSDKLEDYFGLVEGDVAIPLEMLLNSIPLNYPQRKAIVGFLMIQQLRNPLFVLSLKAAMKPVVEAIEGKRKSEDDKYMQAVYETLYENNDLYDQIARPIFWNTWVLLESKTGFVLPDTWGVLQMEPEFEPFYCAPLTPSICFVSLPPREEQKKILPIRLSVTAEQTVQINGLLIRNNTREFISDMSFKGLCTNEAPTPENSVREWIKLNVARINREDGK